MDEINKIKEHYQQQAKECQDSPKSTMQDLFTREKEIEALLEQLKLITRERPNPKILEIGCGNGYVAEQLSQKLNIAIEGIDFCEEFIEIAKQRKAQKVFFLVGDVLELNYPDETFDIIFTERCLINLETWENQQKALENIGRKLKPGGKYILIESFRDGLENLNQARAIIGLEPIPETFHNLFFDKNNFLHFIEGKFEIKAHQKFMSSYFFGSRVLYPALAPGDLIYNNKFIEFFRDLPAYGNYSHLQLYVLEKKGVTLEKGSLPLFKIRWQEADVEAVNQVIRRGTQWAAGPEIEEFEKTLAIFTGRKYALACNSGTSALQLMYQAIDIKGKEVICPSFTFVATANAIVAAGGIPVFAESEAETFGLDADDVEKRITKNTKAIVALHYAGGVSSDIEKLQQLAQQHNLILLEDNAHSLGVKKEGKQCGTFGTAAALSFCQNKLITTGEGGAVITDSQELYEKMELLRSHGRVESQAGDYFSHTGDNDYIEVGYNFRMPTMNAALGLSQLQHFEETMKLRVDAAQQLHEGLLDLPGIKLPWPYPNSSHYYQMYTIMLSSQQLRDELQQHLAAKGIMSKVYYNPIHLKTLYRGKYGYKEGDLPQTEEISKRILTLPLYPGMGKEEAGQVIRSIRNFFGKRE